MRHNALAETLSLDGSWEFAFAGGPWGAIMVPGVWEAQGYRSRAEGPAHYRRAVSIPADWTGRSLELQFDAVAYDVEARVNGQPVGTHRGMWTPFAFDITAAARPGDDNLIELTVYKPGGERFPLRESLAGFLPDVALPFGGVWQSARLVAHTGYAFEAVHLTPEFQTGTVGARVRVSAPDTLPDSAQVVMTVRDPGGAVIAQSAQPLAGDTAAFQVAVPTPAGWSPASPALYAAEFRLETVSGQTAAALTQRFGFRELRADGARLLFNDDPVSLRGALHWGWYPDLLCPAPDAATVREEFRKVRDMGLNMVKLCLFVPSQTYFEVADEMGMFLWLEFPLWLPKLSPALRQRAPDEYRAIIALARHHPSVILVSLGCELGRDVDAAFVTTLADAVGDSVTGMLWCDNSGSGEAYGAPASDASDFYDYHFYCDLHYFDPLVDYFRRDWGAPRPWIFGEFCDADDFRHTDETRAAFGGDLPWWLREPNPIHSVDMLATIEQDARMARLNLPYTSDELRAIAYRQSFMIRKTILEKVRSRAGMGGYVLTSLKDNPLATSALFDDFMRPKYDAAAFQQFNADSVLLLGQGRAREWRYGGDRPRRFDMRNRAAGEPARLNVILAHVGPRLDSGELRWRVMDGGGATLAHGEQSIDGPLPRGDPGVIGLIEFIAPDRDRAVQLTLRVDLRAGDRLIHNEWPFWIYPPVTAWPEVGMVDPGGSLAGLDDLYAAARPLDGDPGAWPDVAVASALTPALLDYLRGGGKALLIQTSDRPLPSKAVPFWREAIKLIGAHPVMRAFPHAGYADMQFYHLASDRALDTARLADAVPDLRDTQSLLGRLDARVFTWTDYLIEARVGAGTLIATTLRFMGGQGDQMSGLRDNVAGRFLLHELLAHLARIQH